VKLKDGVSVAEIIMIDHCLLAKLLAEEIGHVGWKSEKKSKFQKTNVNPSIKTHNPSISSDHPFFPGHWWIHRVPSPQRPRRPRPRPSRRSAMAHYGDGRCRVFEISGYMMAICLCIYMSVMFIYIYILCIAYDTCIILYIYTYIYIIIYIYMV